MPASQGTSIPTGQRGPGIDQNGKGASRANQPTPVSSAASPRPVETRSERPTPVAPSGSIKEAENLGAEMEAPLRYSKHATFAANRVTHPGLE
jgi:hypothetical protein